MSRLDELKKKYKSTENTDNNESSNIGNNDTTSESRLQRLKKRTSGYIYSSDGSDLKQLYNDYETFMKADFDEATASELRGRIAELKTLYDLNNFTLSQVKSDKEAYKKRGELNKYLNEIDKSISDKHNSYSNSIKVQQSKERILADTEKSAKGWEQYLADMEQAAEDEKNKSGWEKAGDWLGNATIRLVPKEPLNMPLKSMWKSIKLKRKRL